MNLIQPTNTIQDKLSEQTYNLFVKGIPSCPILEYKIYHQPIALENKIIFGDYGELKLFIDVNNNETIYLSTPKKDIFLNSSLDSFIKYINFFNIFIQKLRNDGKHKTKYIKEWENDMIQTDEKAYDDKDYYWGAYVEDYQNGILR